MILVYRCLVEEVGVGWGGVGVGRRWGGLYWDRSQGLEHTRQGSVNELNSKSSLWCFNHTDSEFYINCLLYLLVSHKFHEGQDCI